jgi:hypothetical protein
LQAASSTPIAASPSPLHPTLLNLFTIGFRALWLAIFFDRLRWVALAGGVRRGLLQLGFSCLPRRLKLLPAPSALTIRRLAVLT